MNTVKKQDNTFDAEASNDDKERLFNKIPERKSQEIIIALVGPVASGVTTCSKIISDTLENTYGYEKCIVIKPSSIIFKEAHRVGKTAPSSDGPLDTYITNMQNIGNNLREKFGPSYLIEKAIEQISTHRMASGGIKKVSERIIPLVKRRAYIIDSIKHISEYETLKDVYGDSLILFGVFSPDEIRKERLTNKGIEPRVIDIITNRDEQEPVSFGQKTRKVFVESDFFLCNDGLLTDLRPRIERYLELIFSAKIRTPTRDESAMYEAVAASANSACLSRQVGASILSDKGELISVGWNDVPKFGGGLYREDDQRLYDAKTHAFKFNDNRCFAWKNNICHNEIKRKSILDDICEKIIQSGNLKRGISKRDLLKTIEGTGVDAIIEFSRSIHAEMEALISVAREGKHSLVGSKLFTNTYPCHNCARHIVASGVNEVLYIEPYKKSLAIELHGDAITENPVDSEIKSKVLFRQFDGVAPKNYLKLFRTGHERKSGGKVTLTNPKTLTPLFSIQLDAMMDYELRTVHQVAEKEHAAAESGE